jgi:hypothetical protein
MSGRHPPKTEGERWRGMPLSKVADEALENVSEAHKKASAELQRRLIHALYTFHEESAESSRRLLNATEAIVAPTVVLAILTGVDRPRDRRLRSCSERRDAPTDRPRVAVVVGAAAPAQRVSGEIFRRPLGHLPLVDV